MRMLHAVVALSVLCAVVSGRPAEAQRRPTPTKATRAGASDQPSDGASTRNPAVTLLGGIATGEGPWNLGLALSGSFEWKQVAWPVAFRIDPYIARHGADGGRYGDFNLTFVGVGAAASYEFETTGKSAKPYVFGGLGIYHGSANFDSAFPGGDGFSLYDGTNPGISIGGGARIGKRLTLELRYMHIDQFDTVPMFAGFRF